jgi:signal transduction histidine kinase
VAVDRPAQPRRVLALAFPPEALRALLARQNLPPGGFSAIADGHLRVLGFSLDPEGLRVGAPAPEWIATALEGRADAIIVGPGWRGYDIVYAVERLSLAPRWAIAVAEPLSIQRASALTAVGWLVAGGAALGLGMTVVVWSNRREAVRDALREAGALRAGRAEVDRLLGGLPAVIFLREVMPDGTTRLIARKGDIETVMGWPAADFAGIDNFQQWTDVAADDYQAFFERVVREGSGSAEYRLRQPDGSWRHLRSRCRLLSRRPDGTCEVVGYILDVSAEREAQARATAAARLASLGEMAAGLAHEMKQPLQTISLAAEVGQIAAAQGDAAGAEKRFARIVEQTERTADMIEHLRRFARGAEDGALPQVVPLAEAVEGALKLARSALRDASVSVEVDLGDPSPQVCGHEVLLEQVLSNLLLNARDALAAHPPGVPRRVRIAAAPGPEKTVRLTVADTGGGIAAPVMAQIFEPFVTTKGPDKGTGLGLSICHGLVKGMGGSIEAHNDDEGAVFTITLKAA